MSQFLTNRKNQFLAKNRFLCLKIADKKSIHDSCVSDLTQHYLRRENRDYGVVKVARTRFSDVAAVGQ